MPGQNFKFSASRGERAPTFLSVRITTDSRKLRANMPRFPKDPAIRRRRNRASTAALLDGDPTKSEKVPPLLRRWFKRPIENGTRIEWRRIWLSPMSARWLEADLGGLIVYIVLYNEFLAEPKPATAAELRHQSQRFGLDVISRRRLDWVIAQPPREIAEDVDRWLTRREDDPRQEDDPRDILRALQ
jgi:hypothetical protein